MTVEDAFNEIRKLNGTDFYATYNLPCAGSIACERVDSENSEKRKCRFTVRASAALILAVCISAKALYTVIINIRARNKPKSICVSFGDVIFLSTIDHGLRLENQCLANADSIRRREVAHICHKHCTNPVPDASGETIGHCQNCKKHNDINYSCTLPNPIVANKIKHSLISTLGGTSIVQMIILCFCSCTMLALSGIVATQGVGPQMLYNSDCTGSRAQKNEYCNMLKQQLEEYRKSGFGGHDSSLNLAYLSIDSLRSEFNAFIISNGSQLIFSALYLLLIYNVTLVSMEREWGELEKQYTKIRVTLAKGKGLRQSYFLQLPPYVLIPIMIASSLMHWLLGQSLVAREWVLMGIEEGKQHIIYEVAYAPFPLFAATFCMVMMTWGCWWAFFYTREGFIPTMYGSVRVMCSSTVGLKDIRRRGIIWGDCEYLSVRCQYTKLTSHQWVWEKCTDMRDLRQAAMWNQYVLVNYMLRKQERIYVERLVVGGANH
ncbi:hypothetical protein K440DRAFT_680348 [Wilcoxina mikolae CBS 423.85]|nr:hypothetical protein K440DRAFT_680348 [Wilcoxina mikolae CBS 423.85]